MKTKINYIGFHQLVIKMEKRSSAQDNRFKSFVELSQELLDSYLHSCSHLTLKNDMASRDNFEYIEEITFSLLLGIVFLRAGHEIHFIDAPYFNINSKFDTPNRSHFLADFDKLSRQLPSIFNVSNLFLKTIEDWKVFSDLILLLQKVSPAVFLADDLLGWFYHFYVLKTRLNYKKIKGSGTKSPKDNQYLSILNTVYTPSWVIDFLFQNSLIPQFHQNISNEKRNIDFPYFISPKFNPIPLSSKNLDDVQFLDPSCGAGNFMVAGFRYFFLLYKNQDSLHSSLDIVRNILQKNLFGIEINPRAATLCFLSLFLISNKFLIQENLRPFELSEFPQCNIYCCQQFTDSPEIQELKQSASNSNIELEIISNIHILGSLLPVFNDNHPRLNQLLQKSVYNIQRMLLPNQPANFLPFQKLFSTSFDLILTNPPFGRFVDKSKSILQYFYPDSYQDLTCAFIDQSLRWIASDGIVGMISDSNFLHLSTLELFRKNILLSKSHIGILCQVGKGTLPHAGNNPILYLLQKSHSSLSSNLHPGIYRVFPPDQKKKNSIAISIQLKDEIQCLNDYSNGIYPSLPLNWVEIQQSIFQKIPKQVLDFNLSSGLFSILSWGEKYPILDVSILGKTNAKINSSSNSTPLTRVFQGISSGENDRFIRYWFEVPTEKIRVFNSDLDQRDSHLTKECPYVPYSKGGGDVQYYLNNGYIIAWNVDTIDEMKKHSLEKASASPSFVLRNLNLLGQGDIHWSLHSISRSRFCISQKGMLSDVASMNIKIIHPELDPFCLLAYLNSIIGSFFGILQSKDRKWQVGNIARYPVPLDIITQQKIILNALAKESYEIRRDWDTGYPFSPIFIRTHLEQAISPLNVHDMPKTGHPFGKELKISPISISISNGSKVKSLSKNALSFKTLLDAVELRFLQIISRLKEIDVNIDNIFLTNFSDHVKKDLATYCKVALQSKIPRFHTEPLIWLKDFLMEQVFTVIRQEPKGVLLFDNETLNRIWGRIFTILNISTEESRVNIQKELESILEKPFADWILNDFFHYHTIRYGNRPLVWQFTNNCWDPKSAQINLFIYYPLFNSDTIRVITEKISNCDEFNSKIQQFIKKTLILPPPNQIFQNNAIDGQGADMVYRWLFLKVQALLDRGYTSLISDGILVNLLAFCIENPKKGPQIWPQICPNGTLKLILKKIDALDQLREH